MTFSALSQFSITNFRLLILYCSILHVTLGNG
uniref:Uncharacterized protein n=1 Tax=Rhizophora mucronata TaxID=61149 RepID=A0A2P2NG58_RHIMU